MGMTPGVFFQYAKPALVTATLLGLGVWLLGFGWTRVRTDRLLDQRSAVTEGRVIEGSTRSGLRGGQFSSLVVEYTPALHAPITREFDVDGATYKTGLATLKATVTYYPEDPWISRVTRFETLPFQILIGLGGVMLVSGILCLWHFMKMRSELGSADQR